jgi:uncharacterized protein
MKRSTEELVQELTQSKKELFAVREKRVHPGKDDKVIVAWNGLMIDAMARAGMAVSEPRYVAAAEAAAEFILREMQQEGRLLHTWRHGQAKLAAYLDDYAALANSLVTLYEATASERWIDEASRLVDVVLTQFADAEGGGFFYTASDHEQLLTRTKELTDSSVPSGNSLAATALLRLGKLLGRGDYLAAAEKTLLAAVSVLERAPMAAGQMLLALDRYLGPSHELVLVGGAGQASVEAARAGIGHRFLPRAVTAMRLDPIKQKSSQLDELFAGRESKDGEPVLYVCENFACQAPAVGVAAISAALEAIS